MHFLFPYFSFLYYLLFIFNKKFSLLSFAVACFTVGKVEKGEEIREKMTKVRKTEKVCYLLKSLDEAKRDSNVDVAASGAIFYSCSNFMDYNEFYIKQLL